LKQLIKQDGPKSTILYLNAKLGLGIELRW